MLDTFMNNITFDEKQVYELRFQDLNVQIHTAQRLEAVTDAGITVVDRYGRRTAIAADSVVLAAGFRPNRDHRRTARRTQSAGTGGGRLRSTPQDLRCRPRGTWPRSCLTEPLLKSRHCRIDGPAEAPDHWTRPRATIGRLSGLAPAADWYSVPKQSVLAEIASWDFLRGSYSVAWRLDGRSSHRWRQEHSPQYRRGHRPDFLGGLIMNLFGQVGVTGWNRRSFAAAAIGAIVLLGICTSSGARQNLLTRRGTDDPSTTTDVAGSRALTPCFVVRARRHIPSYIVARTGAPS